MRITATIVIAALALVACEKDPLKVDATENPEFAVSTLFVHDGCTVYRFSDGGYLRYFARCNSGTVSTSWRESCGEGCTREVSITTGEQR